MTPRALVATCIVLVACPEPSGPNAPSDAASSPSPAPPRAEADMCAEHGVLEALCTKCYPALAAVFRSKGDWCAEHGFPESICPACHPERGGRPPASLDLALDESPPDGIRVRLASAEVAEVVGVRTVSVRAAPAEIEVHAVATIAYDARRVARLNARAPGVVRRVEAEVGVRVAAGDPLAVVESAAVGEGRARVDAARARLVQARRDLQRIGELAGAGISSDKQLGDARRELEEARAGLAAAESQLAIVGASEGDSYRIDTTIAGVVTRRTASVGAFVDPEALLFEVVDTATMWADIQIAEADLPLVVEGAEVALVVDGIPDRTFSGRVAYLAPELDPQSRTVLARAELDNADGRLRAHMFARATLRVARPPDEGPAPALVPREAVQAAKGVHLVFVAIAPDLYEGRRVRLGRGAEGGLVEVRGRLAAGERVVTDGAFLLKTETLKDSIGAGCCAEEPAP